MALRLALGTALLAALVACGASDESSDASTDDLTSLSARQRILKFEGVVYTDKNASDAKILDTAKQQSRTAFGALLHKNVMAQTREFANVDPTTFKKRVVSAVDTDAENPGNGREMLEVKYTYTDNAIVAVDLSHTSALPLAVFGHPVAGDEQDQIVKLCTANDADVREDVADDLLWYDFDPQRAPCRHAMEKEQSKIDDDAEKLTDPRKQVSLSRVNRLYLPTTMALGRADTAENATYPEYDRLFGNNVEPGVMNVVMVTGRLGHDVHIEARKDDGYYEWLSALDVIFTDHPDFEFKKIEPDVNIDTISAEGHRYTGLKFTDFINWTVYGRGWPEGMPASSRDNIAKTVGQHLDRHWVTFEKKLNLAIGGAAPKPVTIRIETYFGVDDDVAPHRRALSRGDVVTYNGHSYIGEGPLDPTNFTDRSFSNGYQILWFDSCVSYNYYNKDFFTLKPGGSKNLDLISNGIEAPEYESGAAEGRFVSKLIDGSTPSYQTLLQVAKATDALRVVDGELDNTWKPSTTPIRVVH